MFEDALAALTAKPVDPFAELSDVGKAFRRLAPPEEMQPPPEDDGDILAEHPTEIPLDQCESDPYYQRPIDRVKVQAMRRDKAYEEPITVNFDAGVYWIVDGQHRAEAARLDGHKTIQAHVYFMPSQAEHKRESGIMAKADEQGRIPAGDSRRGRIHPGEWTADEARAHARARVLRDTSDTDTLERAANTAHSHIERVVAEHRLAQLRGTVNVPGLLSDEDVEDQQDFIKQTKALMTKKALTEYLRLPVTQTLIESAARDRTFGDTLLDNRELLARHQMRKLLGERAKESDRLGRIAETARVKSRDVGAEWSDFREAIFTKYPGSVAVNQMGKRDAAKWEKLAAANVDARTAYYEADRVAKAYDSETRRLLRKHEEMLSFDEVRAYMLRRYPNLRERLKTSREQVRAKVAGEREALLADHLQEAEGRLAKHDAAQREAKSRARSLKRTQPRFEAQDLTEVETDVGKDQGQVRGIFVEDSPFEDHVVYAQRLRGRVKSTVKTFRIPYGAGNQIEAELGNYKALSNYFARTWESDGNYDRENDFYDTLRAQLDAGVFWDDRRSLSASQMTGLLRHFGPAWDQMPQNLLLGVAQRMQPFAVAESIDKWKRAGTPKSSVIGDVLADQESGLVEKLLGAGAVVTDNELEVPEYHSRHDIDGGRRYTLRLGDGKVVHYVPHGAIQEEVTDYAHTATLNLSSQRMTYLRKALKDDLLAGAQPSSKFVMLTVTVPESPDTPHVQQVLHEGDAQIDSRAYLALSSSATPGRYERSDGVVYETRRASVGEIRKAMKAQQEQQAAIGGGWQDEPAPWVEVEPGRWVQGRVQANYESALEGLAELRARSQPVRVKRRAAYRNQPGKPDDHFSNDHPSNTSRYDFYEALDKFIPNSQSLSPNAKKALRQSVVRDAFEHEVARETRAVAKKHSAPRSERGVLRMEGFTPKEAVKTLKKLGVITGATKSVPYNLIYRGEHRQGRVLPHLHEYATGEASIAPPTGMVVVHGMTGVDSNRGRALERLQNIIDDGGLKSIVERRRTGRNVYSMSPKGDIASGIDTGVPTKIGSTPGYGDMIFFVLKPEVLQRRDVFFADRDFGSSDHRYDDYTAYARSIGQDKIFEPPSDAARQEHLRSGVRGNNNNEAIFRYEIPWDEVAYVVTNKDADFNKEVAKVIKKAQKAGKVPPDVHVVHGTDGGSMGDTFTYLADQMERGQ